MISGTCDACGDVDVELRRVLFNNGLLVAQHPRGSGRDHPL